MPEFILDRGDVVSAKQFAALDSFTQAYIEAMFFTDSEPNTVRPDDDSDYDDCNVWNPEKHSSLPGDVSFADLAPETLARIVADCTKFRDDAKIMACIADKDAQSGHDFWLTRNGHGAGFWDGDWPEPDASYLDARSDTFGNVDTYLGDDGLIYLA